MNAERWEQIKNIFESALEVSPDRRAAMVESACSGDPELEHEVARLLAELDQASGFLEEPRDTAFEGGDLVLGRYRIISLLGRGGMGEVYEAHDQLLDEAIALKTLRADLSHDPAFVRHFRKEIQLARKITHPNVCRVFEVGTHEFSDGRPALTVFTMELIAGETLQKRIETRGSLSPAEAFPLIAQIADGLEAAHQAGIIHGDFKSGNILLAGNRAVITDFGLARVELSDGSPAGGKTTATGGQLAGTIAYMSPEQMSGAALTPASDIYAFGVVLFEMATGRLPFDGRNIIRSAVQRVSGTRIPVRSLAPLIPHRWETVIARCMEREPGRRPRNLAKLAEQFRGERSLRGPSRVALLLRRPAALVIAAALVVLLSLFFLVPRLYRRALKEGSEIIVTPTMNATGEPKFDGLSAALRTTVGQSSRFASWDTSRLPAVLQGMRRDPRAPLKAKDWREVAFRDHASLVVFSTLSRVGDGYTLAVHCEQIGSAPDPPIREWDHTATVSGPDTLFEAVRDSASWIRKTAGESNEEVSGHNKLPQDITSSSWEALELFEQAQEASASDPSAAIALLRRAVQLDPQFAMALMRLGDLLVTQRSSEGYGYWKRAIEQGRAQHLSDRERLTIESRYPMEIGDYKAAEPVLRQWAAEYPNDPRPSEWLGATLISLGRFPEGVSIERERRRKFPPAVFSTGYLIHGLGLSRQLGQIPAEIRVLEGMGRQADALLFEGITAAVQKKYADAAHFFERYGAQATGPQSSEAVSLQAALAADQGNFNEAFRLLAEGIERDKEAGRDGMGAGKASALAFIENVAGHKEESRAWALESVSLLGSPEIVMQSSTLLARAGFISDARRIAARMPAGEGPVWEADRLRSRGELLAATGDYQGAIDVLERAARLEPATRPRRYLARAYALAGLPDRARIVYSRIVDTPWVVWVLPESEWPGQRFLAEQYLTDQKRRN